MILDHRPQEPEQRRHHLVDAHQLLDPECRVHRRRQLADARRERQRVAASVHDHVDVALASRNGWQVQAGLPLRHRGARHAEVLHDADDLVPRQLGRVRVELRARADAHAMTDRIPSGHHEVHEGLIDDHDASVRREIGAGERATREHRRPQHVEIGRMDRCGRHDRAHASPAATPLPRADSRDRLPATGRRMSRRRRPAPLPSGCAAPRARW